MRTFTIRTVRASDARAIWKIRNHHSNRAAMRHPAPIDYREHRTWFKRYLKRNKERFYVAEARRHIIGYLRLDRLQTINQYEISIALDPRYHGRGYGSAFLARTLRSQNSKLFDSTIIASVKKSNIASQKLFLRCNFSVQRRSKEMIRYQYRMPTSIIIASNHDWRAPWHKLKTKRKIIYLRHKHQLKPAHLRRLNPFLIFFPHWSWIIPPEIHNRYECIVFHMTDLPYGRGGTPLQNLILRGRKNTKISSLRVVEGLDAGDIYLKKALSLQGSAQEIYERAAKIIITMMNVMLARLPEPTPQKGPVVHFIRRKPEQSEIPEQTTLSKLYDFIRMLDARGYPHAFLQTKTQKYFFTKVHMNKNKLSAYVEIYDKE